MSVIFPASIFDRGATEKAGDGFRQLSGKLGMRSRERQTSLQATALHGPAEFHFLIGKIMNLDIRLPIGILFSLLGAILAAYGFLGDASLYEQSPGVNLNLGWGIALLLFGLVVSVFGGRAMKEAGRKTAPRS